MSERLELWGRLESKGSSNDYTHAIYDIDTDLVSWYEEEADARGHFRLGHPPQAVTSVGHRPENGHTRSET